MPLEATTELLAKLKATKRLPSPPGTALKVLELTRRDDVEVWEIADVIMSDPALAGRILKFANSPIIGSGRPVSSVRDAVLLLGLRSVKLTVLGFSLVSPDFATRCPGFALKKFWSDSFFTAMTARYLATGREGLDREEAFTAGLMARIGQLALSHGLPEEYGRVLSESDDGIALIETERRILGIDHITFGGQLLADWELPTRLVETIASLNDTDEAPEDLRDLALVVRAAVDLSPVFALDYDPSPDEQAVARRIIEEVLDLTPEAWKPIAEQVLCESVEIAGLFDLKLGSDTEAFDLYAEAQEQATHVGMVAQLERTQAMERNKELLHKASTDALTGVANRAKFDERLEEMLAGVKRGHGHSALLIFDIDHFKRFNDTYGHQAGDLVLQHVAGAVGKVLRDTDMLARYGGEEFAVIAPHIDRKAACTIASRVHACVEAMRVQAGDDLLSVTISLGVAHTGDYDMSPEAQQLVADADAQLYLCKKDGRNTWSYRGQTAARVRRATQAAAGQSVPG